MRLASASTQTLLRVTQAAERLGIEDVRNEFSAKLKEPKHATEAANILRDELYETRRIGLVCSRLEYDDVGSCLGQQGGVPLTDQRGTEVVIDHYGSSSLKLAGSRPVL